MKKKILCVLLTVFMLFSVIGTGCNGDDKPVNPDNPNPSGGGPRKITVGTWFDVYYTSKHTDPYDNPLVANEENAIIQLANMRAIEAKYNVTLDFVNLTFTGIQESITTSIMAGQPDCDIYQVDLQFGIPTVLNDFATSLESMGLQDTDVFNAKEIVKNLQLPGQDETYLFKPSITSSLDVYPLAFNLDMILENNLENPQDLWENGEWTWDKWREYLLVLTDTSKGIYGWSGYWTNMLSNLLFSNDASIAPGPKTTITDPKTLEVLHLIHTIYNTDRTGRPWDESGWEINNNLYAEGRSGFFIGADWLFNEQGGGPEMPVNFEIGVVPWPVGPSGNKDTNRHGEVAGNWYLIPKYVEEPRLVYDVFFDWLNWYDYDTELAVDMEWCENSYMTARNFELAFMMNQNTGLELWNNIGITGGGEGAFSMIPIMAGEETASQYATGISQIVQDALDTFFN